MRIVFLEMENENRLCDIDGYRFRNHRNHLDKFCFLIRITTCATQTEERKIFDSQRRHIWCEMALLRASVSGANQQETVFF